MRAMDRDDRGKKLGGCFRIFVIIIVVVVALFVALSFFRVGGSPEVAIEPATQGIGTRTPVTVRVSEGGRGLSRVTTQLVQGDRVVDLDEQTYRPRGFLAFWGDRTTEDDIELEVGRETVEGLKQGEATLRVVADRAGTWMRSPDPR